MICFANISDLIKESHSVHISKLFNEIREDWARRWDVPSDVILIATFLDPRFRTLSHMESHFSTALRLVNELYSSSDQNHSISSNIHDSIPRKQSLIEQMGSMINFSSKFGMKCNDKIDTIRSNCSASS